MFYPKELRELFDMKIFVDADADTRLARRGKSIPLANGAESCTTTVIRDINQRGRDVMGVLRQYEKFVKPSFDEYINPVRSSLPLPPKFLSALANQQQTRQRNMRM